MIQVDLSFPVLAWSFPTSKCTNNDTVDNEGDYEDTNDHDDDDEK